MAHQPAEVLEATRSSKTKSGVELLDEIKSHEFVYKKSNEDVQNFTKKLNTLRGEENFTDLMIRVKNHEFACHRVVLAASSEYFRALFTHDTDKRTSHTITLNDVSPNGFQNILQFMYSHELTIDLENILDVLEAADFLQFRPVVEKCASMLLQHITTTNCLALHQIGESHLCHALADAAYKFIVRNFEEIGKTKEFQHLGKESLLRYLKDENVQIRKESHLLEYICNWIDFDFKERKDTLTELIQHVNIHSIETRNLHEITAVNEDMKELFKDIIKECDKELDGFLVPKKSLLKKRPVEALAVIPKETTASIEGKRKKEILYYCVKEQKWTTLTVIPFNDRIAYDVAVLDNEIYFTGGTEFNIALDEVMCYSVRSDDWQKLPSMLKCRSYHSSTSMAGKIYVVGGRNQEEARWESRTITLRSDAEEYDPKMRQWTLLEQLLDVPGIGRAGLVPLDGKLYVIGGTMGTEDSNPKQGSSQRKVHSGAMYYDVEKKTWFDLDIGVAMESLKIAVSVGDCLAHEGCILLIDEDLRGKRMAVYNPMSGEVCKFIRTQGSHRFGGYAIQGQVLYLTGGVAGIFKTHDLVHYQDLNAPEGTWQVLAPLPDTYSHHTCLSIFKA